jgi:hypothetical protein
MTPESCEQVRRQHRQFFTRMATECMRWNLHYIPGTDQFTLMREDAVFDVLLPIAVSNVHAMTEDTMLYRAQDYWIRENH